MLLVLLVQEEKVDGLLVEAVVDTTLAAVVDLVLVDHIMEVQFFQEVHSLVVVLEDPNLASLFKDIQEQLILVVEEVLLEAML
tara:strand:- start:980 stop:1228 length:249 start_codon:yes stop_codon:yes gene_type:complete